MVKINLKNEDEILKKYFSQNKIEIEDNGFSSKVMSKLPEQKNLDWIVWLFAAVGIAITLYVLLNTHTEYSIPVLTTQNIITFCLVFISAIPVLVCSALKIAKINCITFFKLRELLPEF